MESGIASIMVSFVLLPHIMQFLLRGTQILRISAGAGSVPSTTYLLPTTPTFIDRGPRTYQPARRATCSSSVAAMEIGFP